MIAQLALACEECQGFGNGVDLPMKGVMRQLNPSTNLVLAVLAGIGLLASLGLPWYAPPAEDPNPTDGPVERGAWQVAQVFATSTRGTLTGADAAGDGRALLYGLVALVAVVALAISVEGLRRGAEDVMRVVALAAPAVVAFVAITHPGTEADLRLHYGMLVAFAAALAMASAAWHGASMRAKPAPAKPRSYSMR
jgi:hypothetical protein